MGKCTRGVPVRIKHTSQYPAENLLQSSGRRPAKVLLASYYPLIVGYYPLIVRNDPLSSVTHDPGHVYYYIPYPLDLDQTPL